jgi:hypothetical protein
MRALVCASGFDRHFCAGDQRCDPLWFSPRCLNFGAKDLSYLFFATAGQATSYQGCCELGSAHDRLCSPARSGTSRTHPVCRICDSQSFFCQQSLLPSASDFLFALIASSSLELSVVWQLSPYIRCECALSMKPLSWKPLTKWAHPAIPRV